LSANADLDKFCELTGMDKQSLAAQITAENQSAITDIFADLSSEFANPQEAQKNVIKALLEEKTKNGW
jgi:hypothetical protein